MDAVGCPRQGGSGSTLFRVNFEWGGRVLDYGEDMNARDIQRLMFVADSAVFLDVFLAGLGGEVAIRQKMGAEK
jgi:hypothetical protein